MGYWEPSDSEDFDFIDLLHEIELALNGIEWIDLSCISNVICVPNLIRKMTYLYMDAIRNREWQSSSLRTLLLCANTSANVDKGNMRGNDLNTRMSSKVKDYYCKIHQEVMNFIDQFQKWKLLTEKDTDNPDDMNDAFFSSKTS